MNVVGLTGGIGSGKSTVAGFFIDLGIPVYFADDHAKRLMRTSPSVRKKLINEFGVETFVNGKLNRPYLANIIFNNKKKLAAINAIVHPAVRNSFKRWVGKQDTPYVIQENAILFENGTYKNFDVLVTVTAPLAIRIDRVMDRDKVSKKEVQARINNQLPDTVKIAKSDYVITNLELDKTKQQVLKIHNELSKKHVAINLKS